LVMTPLSSGRVLITTNGWIAFTTANTTVSLNVRYGTGTAPARGTAATGTLAPQIGAQNVTGETTITGGQSAGWTTVVSGLTVGTAYWFDLTASIGVGFTASSQMQMSVTEF
jgi:hypothetical protein